jgi:hypothetical protein
MVEMVHDRIAAGETKMVSTTAVLRCGNKWKNYHISTFWGQRLSKNRCNGKQLLDDLKEARRYWKLKEEAQDRTLWELSLKEVMDLSQDRLLPTSKKTHRVCITNVKQFILLREAVAVHSENRTNPTNVLCGTRYKDLCSLVM